jgi:ribosomal protein S18 acetylase RimI-like enzyme
MLSRAVTRFDAIGPERREEAMAFCRAHPTPAVFLAGWMEDGGLSGNPAVPRGWILAERTRDDRVIGLCYLSSTGILMPAMSQPSSVEHLYGIARTNPGLVRVIVGDRTLVGALWARLTSLGLSARLSRDQVVYAVTRERFRGTTPALPLRVADAGDLDELVAASAAMAREEAHDDPQSRNPGLFRERIRARVARGRDFVHVIDGALAFKGNIAALSEVGGQLEGIYTLPSMRRRGLGRRGTATLTSWVLERTTRASLLVNDDNDAARALYASLGYEPVYASRTIFVAP